MTVNFFKRTLLGCAAICALNTPVAMASEFADQGSQNSLSSSLANDFSVFAPRPSKKTRLDFALLDEALGFIVIDLGPSLRTRMSKPQATTGSRFVQGHTSPYRMEGTRVTFDYINGTFLEGLTNYRKDLEDVATKVDIATLSRDEQLAFWFNLHNLATLEQVAAAYPIDRPSNIKVKIDGQKYPLDDAKIITISGRKLSLRDIRENIVYRNWKDPKVLYGFYRGEIGSPKLSRNAFTASGVNYILEQNAAEFVNSLRGFRSGSKYRYISKLYQELDGNIFSDFDKNLESHLRKFAREDVLNDVRKNSPFKFDQYESMIADLSGGRRLASSGNALSGSSVIPREVQRFMAESNRKRETLINNGLISSGGSYVVIIEDLVPDKE